MRATMTLHLFLGQPLKCGFNPRKETRASQTSEQ